MISWQIPTALRIIVQFFFHPFFVKKNADGGSMTRRLRVFFFLCTMLALGVSVFWPEPLRFNQLMLPVAAIGVMNSFANYCHWRATKISLSKTSLFTQADDLTALFLGYLILREGKLLTPLLFVGVALCVGSALLYIFASNRNAPAKSEDTPKHGILFWVMLYSLIWGVALFSFRYFAVVKDMTLPSFLLAWYAGSFIGSLGVYGLMGSEQAGPPLTKDQYGVIAKMALTACTSMTLALWASRKAPITITQPVLQIAEMVFPTLVGLWLFKEAKDLNRWMKILLSTGFAGGVILALGYR